jgi:large subunit ribosomal protein L16
VLLPKRVKFRKCHRGKVKGNAQAGTELSFGEYGLQVLERGWITNVQIEAARVAVSRFMQRKGKMWIRIFPDKSVTKKPAETRMGKGKGAPEFWVSVVRPGNILFELSGLSEGISRDALRLASSKIGKRCRFLSRKSMF